jgi:radical SAM superfamily enzyme YgiQ (UPF0313 family)
MSTSPLSEEIERRRPVVALVSVPLLFRGYYARTGMAVDDLGLGALYAVLHEKYDVRMLDSIHKRNSREELLQELLEIHPDYVGFSDPQFSFSDSLWVSKIYKKACPKSVVIYGDIHASLYRDVIMKKEPHIDFVICGEGDYALPKLLSALEAGEPVDTVPGLTFRQNGKVMANPPDLRIKLDDLPYPHRVSILDDRPNDRLMFNIATSRGCAGRCTFCSVSTFNSRYSARSRWRSRSAEHIVGEIESIYAKGGRHFYFCDDNWIDPSPRGLSSSLRVCELIMERGMDIHFAAITRPDSLELISRGDFEVMHKAGLRDLGVGFEAGDTDQLRLYGKRYNRIRAAEQAKIMRELKINLDVCFIMYYPYSTFESTRNNLAFIRDMNLGHLVNKLMLRLCGFSDILIEKRFLRDGLIQRSSDYRTMGIYKFKHPVMDRVCDSLTQLFRQYGTQYFDLRDICYWAAVEEINNPGIYDRCMVEMDKFGDYVLDLYESLLQAHENGTPENLKEADFLVRYNDFKRMMFTLINTWGGLVPCIRNRTTRELE